MSLLLFLYILLLRGMLKSFPRLQACTVPLQFCPTDLHTLIRCMRISYCYFFSHNSRGSARLDSFNKWYIIIYFSQHSVLNSSIRRIFTPSFPLVCVAYCFQSAGVTALRGLTRDMHKSDFRLSSSLMSYFSELGKFTCFYFIELCVYQETHKSL